MNKKAHIVYAKNKKVVSCTCEIVYNKPLIIKENLSGRISVPEKVISLVFL